tara:strand:- start:9006 stop:10562 length:1557 start_codon:yes stop_codon:yes gene_type:complete
MNRTALLSVSDKQGLVPFAKSLTEDHGYQIISSGGTAKALESQNIPVIRVADYTGAPEMLGGRVKTLHPRIHGGILAKRKDLNHQADLEKQKIQQIDLVVVNLYPFKETIKDENVSWDKAIENIDIGGPTLIRAAAKNHEDVVVLTNPEQYKDFLENLKAGEINETIRRKLAYEAFEHTALYDLTISNWINSKEKLNSLNWNESIPLKQKLRYGENPHQNASWYSFKEKGWGSAHQLQGKELSTNNLLDLEAAILTVREFGYGDFGSRPCLDNAAVIIKHTNPCGVAISHTGTSAFQKAFEGDQISAFGGIVALNSCVEKATALELTKLFLECVVAPDFEQESIDILRKKNNLRVLKLPPSAIDLANTNYVRSILGGLLIQDQDDREVNNKDWKVVTPLKPSPKELEDLSFAWKLVRHVRSNAIVIASNGMSLGIGAGQMNRVGAAKLALDAAGERAKGAVLASDGFFPFDDTVRLANEYGISSIIQPGGSIKDQASIDACKELNISMILTNRRHFLH